MMIIVYLIGTIIVGFFLALVDTYLPFIPPATTTLSGFIFFQDYYYIYVIPTGIAMGLGTGLALYGLQKIEGKIQEKITNTKFNKLQDKVTLLVEIIGDYAIIIAHSCGLGTPIAYIYILVEDVNYKRYTIFTIIGRIMLLSLFVAVLRFTQDVDYFFLICVIVVYVVVYLIFIVLLIIHRKKFKLLKTQKEN